MATYYVDFDTAVGNDTTGDGSSGSPFNTIAKAVETAAAAQSDLSIAGGHTILCRSTDGSECPDAQTGSGLHTSGALDLNSAGFTNGSFTNQLIIKPDSAYLPTAEGPQLYWRDDNTNWVIQLCPGAVIDGFRIENRYAASGAGVWADVAGSAIVRNCAIGVTPPSSSYSACIYADNTASGATTDRYYNNFLYGIGTIGVNATYGIFFDGQWHATVEHCTAYNLTTGFRTDVSTSSTATIRNCIAYGCTNDFAINANATANYNATSAASTPTNADDVGTWVTSLASSAMVETGTAPEYPTNGDYRGVSGSALEGAGTTATYATTDMFGNARDGSTPDLGFYEIQAVYNVTGILGDKYGVVQAGLSGLSWAWFDEDVGALNAPTASGGVATSDLSGAFSIDVTGTALTPGQTGTLVIYDSTNEKFGAYRAIIGANGTVRLDSPVLASSYYFDTQTGMIGIIAKPPAGPWR